MNRSITGAIFSIISLINIIPASATPKNTDAQNVDHQTKGIHHHSTNAPMTENQEQQKDVFPKGELVSSNFTGKAWVSMLVNNKDYDLSSYNVTFAPGTRNNWHSHSAGQILFCTTGIGYYQERGKPARKLSPGDVVEIPANTEHWHGASPHSTFSHLGLTPRMQQNVVTWGEPVTDEEYLHSVKGEK